MTQKKEQLAQTEQVARRLRPYRSPSLSTYGGIRQLTTSGSVDRPEGGGQGNMDKRP